MNTKQKLILFTVSTFSLLLIGMIWTVMYVNAKTLGSVEERLNRFNSEYQMVVTDSNVTIFDANRVVGTVRLEGELNDLITSDNL